MIQLLFFALLLPAIDAWCTWTKDPIASSVVTNVYDASGNPVTPSSQTSSSIGLDAYQTVVASSIVCGDSGYTPITPNVTVTCTNTDTTSGVVLAPALCLPLPSIPCTGFTFDPNLDYVYGHQSGYPAADVGMANGYSVAYEGTLSFLDTPHCLPGYLLSNATRVAWNTLTYACRAALLPRGAFNSNSSDLVVAMTQGNNIIYAASQLILPVCRSACTYKIPLGISSTLVTFSSDGSTGTFVGGQTVTFANNTNITISYATTTCRYGQPSITPILTINCTSAPPITICPITGCDVTLSPNLTFVAVRDPYTGTVTLMTGGSIVSVVSGSFFEVSTADCGPGQILIRGAPFGDVEHFACYASQNGLSYQLCRDIRAYGSNSLYSSPVCCNSTVDTNCNMALLTTFQCVTPPPPPNPCTLTIGPHVTAVYAIINGVTDYGIGYGSGNTALIGAGQSLQLTVPICQDPFIPEVSFPVNYTCNATGNYSIAYSQPCFQPVMCTYSLANTNVNTVRVVNDAGSATIGNTQREWQFQQGTSVMFGNIVCNDGYSLTQPPYTPEYPLIEYTCTGPNNQVCTRKCTSWDDTVRVCDDSTLSCVSNLDTSVFAPQCEPHSCNIVQGPATPHAPTISSSVSSITNDTVSGVTVYTIPVGATGIISGYCPSTGGPYRNPTVSYNCTVDISEIQIPVCVANCSNVYQQWNGNECECIPGYEQVCHTCGPLGNCGGRGVCKPLNDGSGNSMCVCRGLYSGEYCQDPPLRTRCTIAGDMTVCDPEFPNLPCDCGTLWSQVLPGGSYSITPYALYTGFIDMDNAIFNESSPGLIINQKSFDLRYAKWACTEDPYCDGFVWLPGNPYNLFTPVTFQDGATYTPPSWIPVGSSYQLHRVDRKTSYNCTDMTLDAYWYYFLSSYRTEIESMFLPPGTCSMGVNAYCQLTDIPLRQLALTSLPWYTAAVKHWQFKGHHRRYSPNPTCILAPLLYDPSTYCAIATNGCEQAHVGDTPCSKHGYCTQSDNSLVHAKPYYCKCLGFSPPDPQGSFSKIPKYMGFACQYATAQFCTPPNSISAIDFCGGDEQRCQPFIQDNNGTLVSKIVDYIPGCQCNAFRNAFTGQDVAASQYTGKYCEDSRCSGNYNCDPPLGNVPAGQSNSVCLNIAGNGEPDNFQCSCGYSRTGNNCQFSSATCMVPGGDQTLPCSNHGTCMPPGLTPQSYYVNEPNYNFTQAWCQCKPADPNAQTTYTGPWCYDQTCSLSVLVPGHGECSNGVRGACYPVYNQGFRCEHLLCEESGGRTLNRTNCECLESKGLTFNPNIPTDPSCWPRCPRDPTTNSLCGNSINPCNMVKDSLGNKTSSCACVASAGWVLNTTYVDPVLGRAPICYQYCLNGCYAPQNVQGWAPGQKCVCPPSTGWIATDSHPRGDQAYCGPNGVWNSNTNKCGCSPLYYGTQCENNKCDNPTTTTIQEGVPDGSTCRCSNNYISNSTFTQVGGQDCNITICGPHGTLNTAFNANGATDLTGRCTCSNIYKTATPCTQSSCVYCQSSYCENGGTVNIANPNVCNCNFPYKTLQPGGYCSRSNCATSIKVNGQCPTHVCGVNGVPGVSVCTCINGWTSPSVNTNSFQECTALPCCSISPCKNNGVWSQSTLSCSCQSGTVGIYCESVVANPTTPAPTLPPISCGPYGLPVANMFCSCDFFHTGTICTVSRCVNGTYDPNNGGSCDCNTYNSGILCEIYTPPTTPPTTPPPTTPPSSSDRESEKPSFLVLLAFVIFCVILY